MEKLYIVIPAYNEAENIQGVVEEWYRALELVDMSKESRLLVIDDGSRDETFQIICGLKEKMPKLLVATKDNSGHGPTLLYGYQYAIREGADFIFQTDDIVILTGNEMLQHPLRVFHGIHGLYFRFPGPFRLPVFPFRLSHLDMRAVL